MNNCPECDYHLNYIGSGLGTAGPYNCFYCPQCDVAYAILAETTSTTDVIIPDETVRLDELLVAQKTERKYLQPFEDVLDKLDKAY